MTEGRKDDRPRTTDHGGRWAVGVKAAANQAAEQAGRPVQYLGSGQTNTEELARRLAREDHIDQGLVAVFTAFEPCLSFVLLGAWRS